MNRRRRGKPQNKLWKFIKEQIIFIVVMVIILFTLSHLFQVGLVSGSSMETTYSDGNRVIMNKFTKNFERNDIIVFKYSQEQENYYEKLYTENGFYVSDNSNMINELHVKRIVGLPGDEVEITNSTLYINGEEISTSLNEMPDQKYTLKDDEYFVAGDNINNSYDSRQHGPIKSTDLYGKVITNK